MPEVRRRVFSTAGMNYICEKATGPDKTCTFKTGKIILQQPIEPAQVKKLLDDGQDGFAHKIYFQEKQPHVQGVSGDQGRRHGV